MAISLADDFKAFLRLLNSKEVEYLLIGGYAVSHFGYARATGDMDIWVSRDQGNAVKLVEVLIEFGFNLPELNEDLFIEEDRIIRMGYPPIRIEILTTISGVEFDSAFDDRVIETLDGISVNLICLADLRKNKLASGRHKDLDDLEHLPTE